MGTIKIVFFTDLFHHDRWNRSSESEAITEFFLGYYYPLEICKSGGKNVWITICYVNQV